MYSPDILMGKRVKQILQFLTEKKNRGSKFATFFEDNVIYWIIILPFDREFAMFMRYSKPNRFPTELAPYLFRIDYTGTGNDSSSALRQLLPRSLY
ncbi:hypothetical protein Trydic_g5868 [Trypoxylus dichotomus]